MLEIETGILIELGVLAVTVISFIIMLKHKTDQALGEIKRVEKELCQYKTRVNMEIATHKEKIEEVNISQASIETDIASIKTSLIRIENKLDRK